MKALGWLYLIAALGSAAPSWGEARFGQTVIYYTSIGPVGLCGADVDGDDDVDLVTADRDAGSVTVALNNGQGHFPALDRYALGGTPGGVVSADLDGDGDVDLVVTDPPHDLVVILSNNGSGELVSAWSCSAAVSGRVYAADFDGDGDPDIGSLNGSEPPSLLLNRGDGSLEVGEAGDLKDQVDSLREEAGAFSYVIDVGIVYDDCFGDFDGDGVTEAAVYPSTEKILMVPYADRNRGKGHDHLSWFPVADVALADRIKLYGPAQMKCFDLDGDGDLDLAGTRRASASIFLLHNLLARPFHHVPVASARGPVHAWTGGQVTLDGRESADPEGEALTYQWQQVEGTPVRLEGQGLAQARFSAPARADTLAFELIVSAGDSVSEPARVSVPVRPAEYRFAAPPLEVSWERVLAFEHAVSAVVAATDGKTAYAATLGSGVFRSRDSGATWHSVNNGLDSLEVAALAVSPADPSRAYASGIGKVWSRDGEQSWDLLVLHRSEDGGESWEPLDRYEATMLWVFGGDLFVGAPREGYGLWRTDDRGDHWVDAYHNMERNDYGARFGTLAFAGDLLSPAVRYVITKWNLYRSWNRGTTWEWLVYPEGNWDHYYNGTLMVSPHTGWVYVGARSGHVFRSRKSGDDWEDVSEGLPQPLEVVCLTADPVERGTVYLGTDQGAYWSRDGGETWSAMPGMQGGRVTALAALGGEPRHLLMVTPEGSTGGAVYRACLRAATGTAVGPEAGDARPLATALHLSYPNPFNARTVISYDLARDGVTHLSIYGTTGQLVRRLVHGPETSGSHSVVWDGLDEAGRPSASGVYFCRLLVGGQGQVGRMVLVR